MGRFHCVESDCATVWVKRPGVGIVGDGIRYMLGTFLDTILTQANINNLPVAQATHYTFIDNIGTSCFHDPKDSYIIQAIANQHEYNPQTNIFPTVGKYDLVATGTYEGEWAGRRGAPQQGVHSERNATVEVTIVNPSNGVREVLWSGDIDFIFFSRYYTEDNVFRYDINVMLPDSCHISQVHTGRDFFTDDPEIEKVADIFPTAILILHNYDGIPGNNQVFDFVYNRPGYLEIVNPREDKDTWESYKIEKLPYLERLEVVPHAYQTLGFNLYQVPIPDDCLNIYLNDVTGAVTVPGIPFPANPFYDSWKFIAQFCAGAGQELPEYYVVCGCQEECPEGTCEVDCGDHICCYGSDGVVVTSISKV